LFQQRDMKKSKELLILPAFNLAFFGGWREKISIDGHYTLITDGNEFVFYKIGDYGGMTWIKECFESPVLSEGDYRYVNDFIRHTSKSRFREVDEQKEIDLFNSLKKYKLADKNLSANINYGDNIIDLETDEKLLVDYDHNLRYLNQNFKYKILDRDLHPAKNTLQNLKDKLATINPFQKWTEIDELPKKNTLSNLKGKFIIDGETYLMDSCYKTDTYYITTPEGKNYSLRSGISAPYYDTIDLLSGHIFTEYVDGNPYNHCFKQVVNDLSETKWDNKIPMRFKHFNEAESYKYNTRLTYL